MSGGGQIPPELRALLDAERSRAGPDEALVQRAERRIATALAIREPAAVAARSLPRRSRRAAVLLAIALLVVGGAAGAAVTATLRQGPADADPTRREETPRVTPRAPDSASSAPAIVADAGPAEPTASVPTSMATSSPPSLTVAPRSALTDERLLLEKARTALARGDAAGALLALDRHRSAHPRGQLMEENEALAVQALLAAGRRDEANARRRSFHQRFPASMLGPMIDRALDGPPDASR